LGGLKAFVEKGIPSYGYFKTIELAKEQNFVVPVNSFTDSLILQVGAEKIVAKFFGEGHTKDNIVGYFPAENILFGGCLIKELKASKGYLGDANVADWSGTVEKVKQDYPLVKIVVPGHGAFGNKKLLDYTIKLFRTGQKDN
jgi:metallo-beta-lactamase class B